MANKDFGISVKTRNKPHLFTRRHTDNNVEHSVKRGRSHAMSMARERASKVAQAAFAASKATMRAISAALKGMVALIASAGAALIPIIAVALVIGMLANSIFGIFFGNQTEGKPLSDGIKDLNAEFNAQIEQIQSDNPHDVVKISNNGTSTIISNWPDVLAIYSVRASTEEEEPLQVYLLDSKQMNLLRRTFWEMNEISYTITTTKAPDLGLDQPTSDEETEYTVLTIYIRSRTADDMRMVYGFDDEKNRMLDELLDPELRSMYLELTGSYESLDLTQEQIAEIMANLPIDLDPLRYEVVMAAWGTVGKIRYFWGGKSLALGWDSRWGQMATVTSPGSPTTGTRREFGMDCSGWVLWCLRQAAGPDEALKVVEIVRHGGGYQYAQGHKREWSDAKPGDIAAFRDMSHVGLVVGITPDGSILIAHQSSSRNDVVVDMYAGPKSGGFELISSPYFYDYEWG
ncbi:C40 family peptidase [Eubacteriales bacterium OttesenSCG-928-N14]|nr:C40 family peptidase [Eubacteriales bacterium OttesenSCG-928-N14]